MSRVVLQRLHGLRSIVLRLTVPLRVSTCLRAGGVLALTRSATFLPTTNHGELTKKTVQPSTLLQRLLQLLRGLANFLQTLFRAFQLSIICAPLVVYTPIMLLRRQAHIQSWYRLLVTTIEICGPVAIKLGQWASTRRDLLPAELCQHLSQLQRRTRPHSWAETRAILEQSYGGKVNEVFSHFDQKPMGSGCCAQVYSAKLKSPVIIKSGQAIESVAVKVLHPLIESQFRRDLTLMSGLASVLTLLFPSLRWLSLNESIMEFSALMENQVNLLEEGRNLLRFHDLFVDHPSVSFPTPVMTLSSRQVLVESFEEGEHMNDFLNAMLHQEDRNDRTVLRKSVADAGVDMLLKMVFRDNFVHGDLHPGNILVRTSNNAFKEIVVLDPGIVSSLTGDDLANFRAVFSAVVTGDGSRVGKLFLKHSRHYCTDEDEFVARMERLVLEARGQQLSLGRVDVSALLSNVFSVLADHKVKLESNYTSVILAIMVLEGLGRTLDPELDLVVKAAPYLL